jgi:DNA polymerase-4
MISRLAEDTWTASRKESRVAHTVVLEPKTIAFRILTRSHLHHSLDLYSQKRFRFVGVGLSNFREADHTSTQPALFT